MVRHTLKTYVNLLTTQEGAGHAVTSASVEVIFDNTDKRISVGQRAMGLVSEGHENEATDTLSNPLRTTATKSLCAAH